MLPSPAEVALAVVVISGVGFLCFLCGMIVGGDRPTWRF